jgi:hypothetical protein
MSDELRYRPCELADMADAVSLINEEHTPDIVPRHVRPLAAVLAESLRSTEALLNCLEHGVSASGDLERRVVRELYERSQAQRKALVAALDLLAADR